MTLRRLKAVKFALLLGLLFLFIFSEAVPVRADEQAGMPFDPDKALCYCTNISCVFKPLINKFVFSFDFIDGIIDSDDDFIYLFEVAGYENESDLTDKKPVSISFKHNSVILRVTYEEKRLFSKFVPAVLYEGKYVPISYGQYVTNPEALADNTSDYPEIDSKKGILLDANTLGTDKLSSLNVKRVVYNIPLSYVIGKSDNPECPTIEYEYDGETYYFNGYLLAGFDNMFRLLTDEGYHITAIILNDWNDTNPEIIHPLSRNKTWQSQYYAFNTEEEAGVRLTEATALFLADRYSGAEYGMVYDWVIANEVNQQRIWNYMDTDDLYYYVSSFEQSFRTFYNAIKSRYSNARVYYSIDHDWNDNGGNNANFFNGKDFVTVFNNMAKARGNYDWGLSIHPYPSPLTRTAFWLGSYNKSDDAPVITPMNMSVLTDLMQSDDMLDRSGEVRSIAVTELGFSSKSAGEAMQAAAFAYCYYIIEDNEYIDCFLLNRETDDADSLSSGLALGIYNSDYSPKILYDVFSKIDTPKNSEYIPSLLRTLKADSLEEALERAR